MFRVMSHDHGMACQVQLGGPAAGADPGKPQGPRHWPGSLPVASPRPSRSDVTVGRLIEIVVGYPSLVASFKSHTLAAVVSSYTQAHDGQVKFRYRNMYIYRGIAAPDSDSYRSRSARLSTVPVTAADSDWHLRPKAALID